MQAEATPATIPQEAVNAEVTKMIEQGAADNMLGFTQDTQPRQEFTAIMISLLRLEPAYHSVLFRLSGRKCKQLLLLVSVMPTVLPSKNTIIAGLSSSRHDVPHGRRITAEEGVRCV